MESKEWKVGFYSSKDGGANVKVDLQRWAPHIACRIFYPLCKPYTQWP
jgi:hypothetical protein